MRTRSEHYYLFGPFRLDLEQSCLKRDGLIVSLTPKAFGMLSILVRNQGSLVDKESLFQELWPGQFVEEGNLTFTISVIRKALGESAQTAGCIETVPKRGYRFTAPVQEVRASRSVKSIAILPFAIVDSPEGGEYLADGLQDALISELAQIRALRVISKSSSSEFKEPATARAMQLDVVVEGSLTFDANRVHIRTQLSDAENHGHLWTHDFDRPVGEVRSWSSEVARAIAQQLQVEVTPSEETLLRKVDRVHPDAHSACLKGRYYWHQFFTEAGLGTALSYFQKAIDLVPTYALAWAGVSGCYSAMAVQSMMPALDASDKARRAAMQAVAHDPLLAESHVSNAAVQLFFDWNWQAVERSLKRSFELSPNHSMAHNLFAHYALARGWGDQAVASTLRGLDLDPMSAVANTDLLWAYLLNRQYDKALEQALSTIEMKCDFPFTHLYLAQIRVGRGEHREAIQELELILPAGGEAPAPFLSMLGYVYGVAGRTDEALKILKRIQGTAKRQYVCPYDCALVCVGIGRTDHAIEFLEQALAERAPRVIWLNTDPVFDSIRTHPRFVAMISRLGL